MRTRAIKYFWWVMFITHTSILIAGKMGALGKRAKDAYESLKRESRMGTTSLITLSIIIGGIVYVIFGSGTLYLVIKALTYLKGVL